MDQCSLSMFLVAKNWNKSPYNSFSKFIREKLFWKELQLKIKSNVKLDGGYLGERVRKTGVETGGKGCVDNMIDNWRKSHYLVDWLSSFIQKNKKRGTEEDDHNLCCCWWWCCGWIDEFVLFCVLWFYYLHTYRYMIIICLSRTKPDENFTLIILYYLNAYVSPSQPINTYILYI